MARGAIEGDLPLRVTVKAVAHIQIHSAHRCRLPQQITMAIRTGNAGAYVGRVIELNVVRSAEVVNTRPGNVFTAGLVGGHLPDFRPVFGDCQMTTHTELHPGDGRIRTLFRSGVAGLALQSSSEMHVMRESDWLGRWLRVPINEIADGGSNAAVGWCKDRLSLRLLRSGRWN